MRGCSFRGSGVWKGTLRAAGNVGVIHGIGRMGKLYNKKKRRWFFKRKGFWIFVSICFLIAVIAAWVGWEQLQPYKERAEDPELYSLDRIDEVEIPTKILDRRGREIGRIFDENRSKVGLDKVPDHFIDALLAQEDQRFYEHDGVDWVGVGRAGLLTARHMKVTQGASTITMQLARNAFDLQHEAEKRGEGSFERKIVEAFLALRIEREMGEALLKEEPDEEARKKMVKLQILEYYLNRIPFGSGYYGVRAASLGYFGKEPADMEIEECASLVACVKNPTVFSPLNSKERNKTARDHVLRRMALEEMITEGERDKLLAKPVIVNPKPILRGKSYLYETIVRQARREVGEDAMSRGGFVINTTIDLELQKKAERSLMKQLAEVEATEGYTHDRYKDHKQVRGKPPEYLQGALLMVNHESGEVLAHVGGRNYAHSQYDIVEKGASATGTAFFPFIYAAAFEKGKTPATPLKDEPMDNRQLMVGGTEGVVAEWGMEVLNPDNEGTITARRGLTASKVAATVRLGSEVVGLGEVMETARGFGLSFPEGNLLNRMLVGWDQMSLPQMVSAYSAFPRGGTRLKENFYIRSIQDGDGETRFSSPYLKSSPETERCCSDATAYQIHTILNDTLQTGNLADSTEGMSQSLFQGGAKSGTPYGFGDSWMVGYTSKITCGVWVGFLQGGTERLYEGAFAKDIAMPVWKEVMNSTVQNYASSKIKRPESIVEVAACRDSGMRSTRYCSEAITNDETGAMSFQSTAYIEFFKKGEKIGICPVHGHGMARNGGDAKEQVREALPLIPVRATGPLLIGPDPYQSETPLIAPEGEGQKFVYRQRSFVIGDQVNGEREASIQLTRPPRMQLVDDAEDEEEPSDRGNE